MSTALISTPTKLRDLLPRTKVWDATLVFGFAALTAICAQISIPLGFTPVPISGQTFAVLLSGAVLGSKLGASSQILYVAFGAVGFPVFQDATGGWDIFVGSTGGYIVGFIVAAYVVGYLSERNGDRNVINALSHFVLGTIIIYSLGALWLSHIANIPLFDSVAGQPDALSWGVTPFLVGDLIKVIAAALFVPGIWKSISFANRKQ